MILNVIPKIYKDRRTSHVSYTYVRLMETFIPRKKMSWEGQELQASMKEFVNHLHTPAPQPTEQLTMESLLQQFNELKQHVQETACTRKAPKLRKVTLVSLDAKLDLLTKSYKSKFIMS